MLAEHGVRRIEQAGNFGAVIQCDPVTSIPFWKMLGFSEIEERQGCVYENRLAYAFPRRFELPAKEILKQVRVQLRTEYLNAPAPREFVRNAALTENGKLLLDERIAAFVDDPDTIVKLQVGNEVLAEKKVKYSEDVGVQYKFPFMRLDYVQLKQERTDRED